MSSLTLHILFGGLSILSYFFLFFWILEGDKRALKKIKLLSTFAALSIFVSWLFGGYYYVTQYGQGTRAKILEGSNPWSHKIFMEAKEHIFLFLPFVSLLQVAYVYNLGEKINLSDVRKSIAALTLLLFVSTLLIAGMGYVISGVAWGIRWFG